MKPLTNQRRQTPAASPAQSLHRASVPHAETGWEICNLCEIIFRGAELAAPRGCSMRKPVRYGAATNRLASDRKISTELDQSDFHVTHFSVFAQPLTKNAPPTPTPTLK